LQLLAIARAMAALRALMRLVCALCPATPDGLSASEAMDKPADSTFTTTPDTLKPRRADGLGRGAMLAIFVHVCLIIALAFGVNWRASEPEGTSAELWANVPQQAAPPARPAVEPPTPAPRPEPAPPPPPKPTAPDPAAQAARDAQIATEKAEREEKEKREAEQLAREREEKQRARERDQKERDEKARQERDKQQELEQIAKERADKEAAEKAAAEKRKQEQEKAEAQRLAKLRAENLARMMGQAGGSGAPSSTGNAARDAGPSSGYAGRIKGRIKPNLVFTGDLPSSAPSEVEVSTSPDGRIIGRRLTRSSGSREWDDAVLRAIDRTEMLPRDTDGRIPSKIIIEWGPNE
jgi:colicin import membrane protein